MDSLVTNNVVRVKPSELLRIADAAMLLDIAQETIRRRISRGEVPAWGKKGTLRVRIVDLMPQYTPGSESK